MEAIVLYTDILLNTPADSGINPDNTKAGNGQGDLPAIIGSFSADKDANGNWKISVNENELTEQKPTFPTPGEITKETARVNALLLEKTGYGLIGRPDLDLTLARDKMRTAINNAYRQKLINGEYDTGYDINSKEWTKPKKNFAK